MSVRKQLERPDGRARFDRAAVGGTELVIEGSVIMREPLYKFPKRPTGPDQTRRTIAECRAMLANPRLSPELRHSLEIKVAELQAELRADTVHRARDTELNVDEPESAPRSPRR